MGDGWIFLKSRCDASFNKDLSNEPNFDRIHLLDSTFKLETVTMLFMHLIAKTGHVIICPKLSFYRIFLLVRVGVIFCWKVAYGPMILEYKALFFVRIRQFTNLEQS